MAFAREKMGANHMKLQLRRLLALIIDLVVTGGLVSIFYFCANVFYLDSATTTQAELMLICAVITVGMLTVALPASKGYTVGECIAGIRVENIDGTARTIPQIFMRECVLRFAFGPLLLMLSVVYWLVFGMLLHGDPDIRPIHDEFLHTRTVPAR